MEGMPEDEGEYGMQIKAGEEHSASTWSRLKTSFSSTPQRALEHTLHHGIDPTLGKRGQPFVPHVSQSLVAGCEGRVEEQSLFTKSSSPRSSREPFSSQTHSHWAIGRLTAEGDLSG